MVSCIPPRSLPEPKLEDQIACGAFLERAQTGRHCVGCLDDRLRTAARKEGFDIAPA